MALAALGQRELMKQMFNQKEKDMAADKKSEKKDDPCWKGYEQVGMKEKDGKQVPNCVPENKKSDGKGKS